MPAIVTSSIRLSGLMIWLSLMQSWTANAQTNERGLLGVKNTFLQEFRYHARAVGGPGLFPDRMLGEPIGGEYTWPSFMTGVAAYCALTGSDTLLGHTAHDWVVPILNRSAAKGNTFSSLYAAQTLYVLAKQKPVLQSAFWHSLSSKEQEEWLGWIALERSYAKASKSPAGGRPRNYLAVAALVEAYALAGGLRKDRADFDMLISICSEELRLHEGWIDDDKSGLGRYDRYSFEFGRFLLEATELAGTAKQKNTARAIFIKQHKLFVDMLDSFTWVSFHYGRSLQNVWDDSFEQAGSLGLLDVKDRQGISPLRLLINSFHVWRHTQYDSIRHLNRMLEPGRSTYSYATRERIWATSLHSMTKVAYSILRLEKDPTIVDEPIRLEPGSRLITIAHKGKTAGIWTVRADKLYFQIPFVGSFKKPFTGDYNPLPFAWPGISVPVQQNGPYGVPLLYNSLNIGYGPAGVPDRLVQDNQKQVRAEWFGVTSQDGIVDSSIHVEGTYQLSDSCLKVSYTYRFFGPMLIDRVEMLLPTSYPIYQPERRIVVDLEGRSMRFSADGDGQMHVSTYSPVATSLALGAFRPVAQHLYLTLKPGSWEQGKTYRFTYRLFIPPQGGKG